MSDLPAPLHPIAQHVAGLPALQALVAGMGAAQPAQHLIRNARAVVAAAVYLKLGRPVVLATSSVENSRMAFDALRNFIGVHALRLAEPNTAFYDTMSPVRDVVLQRSSVLAALGGSDKPLVVASPRAMMQPVSTRRAALSATRTLMADQTVQLEQLITHWIALGYEPQTVVELPGQFSRRGGIIDVWSPAMPHPVRIELFGDQIDSLRMFDAATQRSGGSIDKLLLTALDDAGANERGTLLDVLGADGILIMDDEAELAAAWEALETRAERERESMGVTDPIKPYVTWQEFSARANGFAGNRLVLGQRDQATEGHALVQLALAAAFAAAPHFGGQLSPFVEHLQTVKPAVVVVSRQAARLADVWAQAHADTQASTSLEMLPQPGQVQFCTGALPGGWQLADLHVYSDSELFGYVRPEPATYARARRASPERAFADWSAGDAVVHEDYGVGIYRGLTKLMVAESGRPGEAQQHEREYLLVEFAGDDRVYVPLHHLDRVTRYVGSEDLKPVLTKLNTGEWQHQRQKARGAAAETAREMLKLYAERELAEGYAFGADTVWQSELEASFPFVETEDQLRAIVAVKEDMQRKRPMDRLVCGDVGFGKTEVALRAAFKAVQEGKQVAVLVPTTILAQQHFNSFVKRLGAYPVKIDMLSRFRTVAEKRDVHERMAKGEIDLVIGTHGLVAERTRFKDLGLLIIDEEQRFGLKDKERLKKVRASVDVLTLTATPIPRTLYMGLSGIRDISRIETPPVDRLPVISYVGPVEDVVLQQAIRRELDRDGQVFVVHNRIQTIGTVEQRIKKLVPEATMAIAHGQLEERKLAQAMNAFSDGRFDILLCTNIIESGLDIPNAKTIINDRADMFGLGELYQLRGRVGRSSIQAYAYFLHERRGKLTDDARERLETMREARGIGEGYMIAMRDLELRGAGDMLGPKQSGHVVTIGLDLYTRLLAREVGTLRALRDGTELPAPEQRPITIDVPHTVGLPDGYVPDSMLRVQMYRRVASLDSEAKVQAFEEELADRFGRLPQPALNLTYQARLKLHAQRFDCQSITSEGNRFTVRSERIEQLPAGLLRIMVGEDGLIGRKQVSWLRNGTADEWRKKLMDVVSWMGRQFTE